MLGEEPACGPRLVGGLGSCKRGGGGEERSETTARRLGAAGSHLKRVGK